MFQSVCYAFQNVQELRAQPAYLLTSAIPFLPVLVLSENFNFKLLSPLSVNFSSHLILKFRFYYPFHIRSVLLILRWGNVESRELDLKSYAVKAELVKLAKSLNLPLLLSMSC